MRYLKKKKNSMHTLALVAAKSLKNCNGTDNSTKLYLNLKYSQI